MTEEIADLSARLVVNRASFKTKFERLSCFIDQVQAAVDSREARL